MARTSTASAGQPAVAFASELEARLAALSSPEHRPRELAELFRFTFTPDPGVAVLLYQLQKRLLRETVEHARAATVYYRSADYGEWIDTGPEEPPDLSGWPFLRRRDVIDRFDDFLATDRTFSSCCHTSGATGPSLSIHKSREELAFLWSYFLALQSPAFQQPGLKPLTLSLPNVYHGVPVQLPSVGRVFVSGVTDDLLVQDAIKVLDRRYRIPGHESRISVITGLSYQLEFFTSHLLELGRDPREFGVRSINIVGNYSSRALRRFLSEAWGCLLFERFTLTESAGGASRCLRCDAFHFDPHVIAEVVDVDTGAPLAEGVGRLVLTQLFPFVQIQPLLRYHTGDLVRRVRRDCSSTLSFEFLGKEVNCIGFQPAGTTEWLLFSAVLQEILSDLPDIRLFENFATVRRARDRTVGSPALYTQQVLTEDGGPLTIRFCFELRYSPPRYPERVAALERRLREGLRAAASDLARRLDDGSVVLDISFAGPGALGDAIRMKV